MMKPGIFLLSLLVLMISSTQAQNNPFKKISITNVGPGWAGNSVNAVVFRKNSITSFGVFQFVAYYDNQANMVIGKRKMNETKWELRTTQYKGNVSDAHNCISIAVDGEGFLHLAWDHHNSILRYCKSVSPLSLDLTECIAMIGNAEQKVSYPEFYLQPSGGLLFFYRDGGSGNGNLVINSYDPSTKQWKRLQHNLIDGEGKRNAYWQACIDAKGFIHISWVWRENPDVASNHDMSYAISKDGGQTWMSSSGKMYTMPIRMATAEKIAVIPQSSELINQTSMCTDTKGNPIVASYWKGAGEIPQYQVLYKKRENWKIKDSGFRHSDFSLSGKGTKKIPVSRPQVISWGRGRNTMVAIIFRDIERGNNISLATNKILRNNQWQVTDLFKTDVGEWEPSYDTERWKNKKQLHLFVQKVTQADSEGLVNTQASQVQVLSLSDLENN
jgi:hypothetical protein